MSPSSFEGLYRALVRRTLRHDGYFVTYFHPWEFSSLSKRAQELKVPRVIRMNLGQPLVGRRERLVAALKADDVEFKTIRDYLESRGS